MKLSVLGGCSLALLLAAVPSQAVGPPTSGDTQLCSDKLQNETLLYVNSVQKQVRLSIKNNLKAKDSKCAGAITKCAGGPTHGATCDTANGNADCTSGECTVDGTKGISGAINKAKAKVRSKVTAACLSADLLSLFGIDGSPRCPDPDCPPPDGTGVACDGLDPNELVDCILQGGVGDIADALIGDVSGEVLGRSASDNLPDVPAPISICGVTLATILQVGSESSSASNGQPGGAAPQVITPACAAGVCGTRGQGVVGNTLTIAQTYAGVIPVCLWTKLGDADPGVGEATAIGTIDLNDGSQSSFTPINTTVLIGTTCPVCVGGICDSGTNNGQPCSASSSTDVACPPAGGGPIIPNPLNLNSAGGTLSVPANNPAGGSTNPSATFCGSCDVDDSQGCQNDADCVATGACSGIVGSGCCVFGTNTGAFGVDSATSASADGVAGPLMPRLGAIFCTGKTTSGLLNTSQGLPGPVRIVQQQLNAFQYPP
jgi:hypothetical protein